jgi:dTDP-4-dehydrorhamnose 3,5-epimerase
MQIIDTGIEGLKEIVPAVYSDERGFFFEAFHEKRFRDAGLPHRFVQDNQSFSTEGVLRGLHFQEAPHSQGKLVRVISGTALDVAVDIRPGSPTFGKSYSVLLEANRQNMLYIPEGFAHGFLTLTDCIFFYKCTQHYHKDSESGILWNDPDLNIDWGNTKPIVSLKDAELPTFADLKKRLKKN